MFVSLSRAKMATEGSRTSVTNPFSGKTRVKRHQLFPCLWVRSDSTTMTMTMTHSNKVSTGCQPCPTDSNGQVVTSVKRVC